MKSGIRNKRDLPIAFGLDAVFVLVTPVSISGKSEEGIEVFDVIHCLSGHSQ
ncbi:MAG: hypothetical protein V7775_14925 [Sulfitobacter sp.]